MTTEATIFRYNGLSTDTKPTLAGGTRVPNGSVWRELDTRKVFFYNVGDDAWYQFIPYVDASTLAAMTIEYEHHEIHSGDHYFVEDVQDIAINAVYDLQWTTPNTTEWAHFDFELNCEAETEWYIYEGASIVNAGTAITPVNNNRNSAHTSTATIAGILNADLADANVDTPTGAATQIAHGIIGAGRNGGVITRDKEIILKQNTIYCMRAIANAAGYINFLISWYEHTNKS